MRTLATSLVRGLAGLAMATGLSAQAALVGFTVDGRIFETRAGYGVDEPVSFTFVLNDYAPAPLPTSHPASPCCEGPIVWNQLNHGQPHLWSAVRGTGLTGDWAPRNSTSFLFLNLFDLRVNDSQGLGLSGSNFRDASGELHSGLFARGFEVTSFQIQNMYLGIDPVRDFGADGLFGPVAREPDATEVFSTMGGTYERDTGFFNFARFTVQTPAGNDQFDLVVSRITIGLIPDGGDVPEPATELMALLGLGLVGASRLRRSRSGTHR